MFPASVHRCGRRCVAQVVEPELRTAGFRDARVVGVQFHDMARCARVRGEHPGTEVRQHRVAVGPAARDFVCSIIGADVCLINLTHGKFGRRVVASVLLADGRDHATLLLATGHAPPYRG